MREREKKKSDQRREWSLERNLHISKTFDLHQHEISTSFLVEKVDGNLRISSSNKRRHTNSWHRPFFLFATAVRLSRCENKFVTNYYFSPTTWGILYVRKRQENIWVSLINFFCLALSLFFLLDIHTILNTHREDSQPTSSQFPKQEWINGLFFFATNLTRVLSVSACFCPTFALLSSNLDTGTTKYTNHSEFLTKSGGDVVIHRRKLIHTILNVKKGGKKSLLTFEFQKKKRGKKENSRGKEAVKMQVTFRGFNGDLGDRPAGGGGGESFSKVTSVKNPSSILSCTRSARREFHRFTSLHYQRSSLPKIPQIVSLARL